MKKIKLDIELNYAKLLQDLKKYDTQYHTKDNPKISDKEYDLLYEKLVSIEKEYPHLVKEESPSQKVHSGKKNKTGFNKAYHSVPMLSLKKLKSLDDLAYFEFRLKEKSKHLSYYLEPKLDGLAIELIYRDTELFKAITRGDGIHGEDVTENAKTIESIPKSVDIGIGYPIVKIRGEVVMLKKDFEALNKSRKEKGESLFSNSRNAASGSLRQLDPNVTKERKLEFYAYAFGERLCGFNSQSEFIKLMKDLKIQNTGGLAQVHNSRENIELYFESMKGLKPSLPFDIDGIVIKANDFKIQVKMGATKKYPKWAAALKFDSETALSVVKDIEISVGKTGIQTPIAIIEPVKVDGVLIGRVNLGSLNKLRERGIKKGDKVEVYRAGNVIPALRPPVSLL